MCAAPQPPRPAHYAHAAEMNNIAVPEADAEGLAPFLAVNRRRAVEHAWAAEVGMLFAATSRECLQRILTPLPPPPHPPPAPPPPPPPPLPPLLLHLLSSSSLTVDTRFLSEAASSDVACNICHGPMSEARLKPGGWAVPGEGAGRRYWADGAVELAAGGTRGRTLHDVAAAGDAAAVARRQGLPIVPLSAQLEPVYLRDHLQIT